jgi:hypothetical protein
MNETFLINSTLLGILNIRNYEFIISRNSWSRSYFFIEIDDYNLTIRKIINIDIPNFIMISAFLSSFKNLIILDSHYFQRDHLL